MKYALVILALSIAPCLAAQGRFKASPEMLSGHFDAPAQDPMPSVLDVPPPALPSAPTLPQKCRGWKCKVRKLTGVARELTPYAYLGYLVGQNVYSWQRAMDPFPTPKKPK